MAFFASAATGSVRVGAAPPAVGAGAAGIGGTVGAGVVDLVAPTFAAAACADDGAVPGTEDAPANGARSAVVIGVSAADEAAATAFSVAWSLTKTGSSW